MFLNLSKEQRIFFIGDLAWILEGVMKPAPRPYLLRRTVDLGTVSFSISDSNRPRQML